MQEAAGAARSRRQCAVERHRRPQQVLRARTTRRPVVLLRQPSVRRMKDQSRRCLPAGYERPGAAKCLRTLSETPLRHARSFFSSSLQPPTPVPSFPALP